MSEDPYSIHYPSRAPLTSVSGNRDGQMQQEDVDDSIGAVDGQCLALFPSSPLLLNWPFTSLCFIHICVCHQCDDACVHALSHFNTV